MIRVIEFLITCPHLEFERVSPTKIQLVDG